MIDERAVILDKLIKLQIRLRGKTAKMPAGECTDVDTHLAGLFLKTHMAVFIEALKRMDC